METRSVFTTNSLTPVFRGWLLHYSNVYSKEDEIHRKGYCKIKAPRKHAEGIF